MQFNIPFFYQKNEETCAHSTIVCARSLFYAEMKLLPFKSLSNVKQYCVYQKRVHTNFLIQKKQVQYLSCFLMTVSLACFVLNIITSVPDFPKRLNTVKNGNYSPIFLFVTPLEYLLRYVTSDGVDHDRFLIATIQHHYKLGPNSQNSTC